MHPIVIALARLGGIAQLSALAEVGFGKRVIQRSVARGLIMRVRRGWYALASADPDTVRAVRVGGRLACVSACRQYGIWTPEEDRLHVAVAPQANHLKHSEDANTTRSAGDRESVIHWTGTDSDPRARAQLPSLVTALADVAACQPLDIVFSMVESAFHRSLLTETDRWNLHSRVPARCRTIVLEAGNVSESGTESLFAFRMRSLGVELQPQVDIAGVGRVDFLIGDRMIVEIDSEKHHGQSAHRKRDLHRDAVAAALSFISFRFDYWQIIDDWATVEAAVMATVSRGDHLGRLQPML